MLTGVKSIPDILSARPIMLPRLVRALVAMKVVVNLGGVPWTPRARMIELLMTLFMWLRALTTILM